MVADADHEHGDAEHDQREAEVKRGPPLFRTFDSCSFWKIWKIVKPKPISENEVRITDISVRSALMRVRWNDIPVRRDASSVEMLAESDCDVIRALACSSMRSPLDDVHLRVARRRIISIASAIWSTPSTAPRICRIMTVTPPMIRRA